MGTTATRRLLAASLASALSLSGCSLQERKQQTARIIDAADLTLALGLTDATLSASIRPHDVNGRRVEAFEVDGERIEIPEVPLPKATVALDLSNKRAVIVPSPVAAGAFGSVAGNGMPEPATGASAAAVETTIATAPADPLRPARPAAAAGVSEGAGAPAGLSAAATLITGALSRLPVAIAFSDWDIFVRPSAGGIATGGGVQAGGGAWLWLDVSALDPDLETTLPAPAPTLLIPPHLLVLLLEGALTGSVRPRGREEVGGVSTTRYRCNVDRDKAARDLNDTETQKLDRLFEAADIEGSFYDDVEVWVDDAGIARRIKVTFEQRVDILTSFDMTYELELGGRRSDPLPLPSNDDLAEVPTLPELLPGGSA